MILPSPLPTSALCPLTPMDSLSMHLSCLPIFPLNFDSPAVWIFSWNHQWKQFGIQSCFIFRPSRVITPLSEFPLYFFNSVLWKLLFQLKLRLRFISHCFWDIALERVYPNQYVRTKHTIQIYSQLNILYFLPKLIVWKSLLLLL